MGVAMSIRQTVFRAVWCLSVAVGAASWSAASPAVFDETAVCAKLNTCLCRVSVQNKWGVPLAFAYGFVLGNGRFVVTELGALAQPGVAKAVMRFRDGSEVTADQFGMADPVSGLVALYLKAGDSSRQGLAPAQTLPQPGGSAVVPRMGWEQGHELRLAAGRLIAGPRMVELAARTGTDVTRAKWTFLRIVGQDVAGVAGTPILDQEGTVLGVRIHVMTRMATAPLVVPATALRDALFSSKPELKPLAEVPEAAWQVRVLRVEGQPVTAAQFGRMVQSTKDGMKCRACNGQGYRASIYSGYRYTCYTCGAEGIVCTQGAYPALAEMAGECTRVAWAQDLEPRPRKAMLAAGLEMLKQLADAGPRFRSAWDSAVATDLLGMNRGFPRGIVVCGRVGQTVQGPDGRYTFLETSPAGVPVAFRATPVTKPTVPGPIGTPAAPSQGTCIVLGGMILATFDTDKAYTTPGPRQAKPASRKPGQAKPASRKPGQAAPVLPKPGPVQPVYVLPFGWLPAPSAAPPPAIQKGSPYW